MTTTPEELHEQVNRVIRNRRMDTVRDLGPRCALWLAAPPLWTRSVAETTGFPVAENESVIDFVRRARDAGWCKTRGSMRANGSAELRFWMPDELRRDVLGIMEELASGGLHSVQQDTREIATSVVRHADEVDLPGPLRAWAELCAEVEPDDIPAELLGRVKEALDAQDLGRAQELVNAGKVLEPVIEGTIDPQLRRARLLLDRGLERHRDEVALSRYLDRRELSEAIAGLLASNGSKWALHLQGVGGVGKSMLIRYLKSGKFAENENLPPISIGCVNFDHVSPDYPVRKPVQLLLELADELEPYAAGSDQTYRALRAFYDQADSAHQAASGLRDGSTRPLDDPDVRRAVDAFAGVIKELGGALLILDTCEELAKWSPGNLNSPAIEATLGILERLHQQAGSVRVLLAGRRPLPELPWLDKRTVGGFTLEEARQYLALPEDRTLAADLADEIIRQSRALDQPVPDPGQLPARVNPFDLALYRAWANEEPHLSVTDVARGNDSYVESRVIQRLDDPLVTRSLPMLAAGGKCRVEAIAAALQCDAALLGRRLAAQEWIEAEGGIRPAHVAAWPSMAERLRRYYDRADRRAEFSQVMSAFAEILLPRLDSGSLAWIDAGEVVTALRWATPDEAAALWDSIASRAAEPPGRWSTVDAIARRILGEWADSEWPTTEALRATVLAAYIAAYRRDKPLEDVRELWETVLAQAAGHPDPARRRQLRALGALGQLPYEPGKETLWDVLHEEQPILLDSPEVGTAAIDAMHRLLEAGHADATQRLRDLLDLDSFRFAFAEQSDVSPALAWATVADARLLADNDAPAAVARLEHAERLALARTSPRRSWPHWVPPDDLLARVWIERGLIAPPPRMAELDRWEQHAAGLLDLVDGERLASLCLRLRLREMTVAQEVAHRWESVDRYKRGRVATNTAHDLVPPLFVSVAQAWLSAGQPERALAVLELRRSTANAARNDEATVRQAETAIVGLARRLRLTGQRSLVARLADPAEYRSEAARKRIGMLDDAWRAWAVIHREPPPEARVGDLDRLAGWHAWWQCQTSDVPEPVPPVPWSPGNPDADIADLADIQADLMEMRLLGRFGLEDVRRELNGLLDRSGQSPRRLLSQVRSADPYRGLRLDVRWDVIDQMRFTPPSGGPVRLIAEMAFEEAELLALRLPAAAAWIYLGAANAYRRCGDHVGRLLALAAFHDVLSECPAGERASLLSTSAARATLREELAAIAADNPELAAILAGPPEDAGPWQYWAKTLQRHIEGATKVSQAGTHTPSVSPAGPPKPMAGRDGIGATAILRVLLGVLALPMAVLLAGGIRAVFRLAAERGVGAAPIETLTFDATINEAAPSGPGDTVRLRVRPLPGRSASVSAWSRLRLRATSLAVGVVRFGWPGRPTGYSGFLPPGAGSSGTGSVHWEPPLDLQRGIWWHTQRQAPVAGSIRTSRIQTGRPWERILSASLSPASAGRIEWVRLAAQMVRPVYAGGSHAELIAAPAWDRPIAGYYRGLGSSFDAGVPGFAATLTNPVVPGIPASRVRHVIGRAVRTSAGPCMNVSGKSGPGRDTTLLAAGDLARGGPLAVVLQAEPADEKGDGGVRHYDLEDKLRLAWALLEDGVPAVLILPALPARLMREVAQTVAAFAAASALSGKDVQAALLRPLRTVIAQHVEPAVLDDVILFLNASYA